jgi:hypothetical protein
MNRHSLLVALAVSAVTCGSAVADTDIGFKSAGVAVGVVSPDDVDATFGFGVFADLGNIAPRLRLEPRADYWSQTEDVVGGGEVSVRDIAVGARGKYYFPIKNSKMQLFGGSGLGVHFVKAEVAVFDPFSGGTMSVEESSTKVGLDLGGGLLAPLNGSTSFLGELWYSIVSDVSHFQLRVGLSHAFGS